MTDSELLEVIVHSTVPAYPGRISLTCDSDQDVASVIEAFCKQQGIIANKNFTLRNAQKEALRNSQILSVAGVSSGDVLFLEIKERAKGVWCCGCNHWWLLGAIALLVACGGLVIILVLKFRSEGSLENRGIVIDAGSNHTQLYVYSWNAAKLNGTAVVQQVYSCHEEGGVANYAGDPDGAGRLLQHCLQEAASQLPADELKTSPVYFGATAGMRLLRDVNSTESDAVMAAVRKTISTFPFDFKSPEEQAVILEGEQEGAYGWVTANVLSGSFGQLSLMKYMASFLYNPATLGTLDIGGASTQVTFVPEDSSTLTGNERQDLLLYGSTYHVYTHSYLCYGLNEAYKQHRAKLVRGANFSDIVTDPCQPLGSWRNDSYDSLFTVPCTMALGENITAKGRMFGFVGSSNDNECRAAVANIFNSTAPCSRPPCTFNGVHQPPVHGNYLAFAGYYYVLRFLNLTSIPNFSLEQVRQAASNYCIKNWTEVQKIPMDDYQRKNAQFYCFQAQYLITLLTSYGFNDSNWHTISFVKKINNTDMGWTVGLMVNASNIIPAEYPSTTLSMALFLLLLLLFVTCGCVAIGLFRLACKTRRQQELYHRLNSFTSTASA